MTSNEAEKKNLPHQKFWVSVEKKFFFPDFFFFFFAVISIFSISLVFVWLVKTSETILHYTYIYIYILQDPEIRETSNPKVFFIFLKPSGVEGGGLFFHTTGDFFSDC